MRESNTQSRDVSLTELIFFFWGSRGSPGSRRNWAGDGPSSSSVELRTRAGNPRRRHLRRWPHSSSRPSTKGTAELEVSVSRASQVSYAASWIFVGLPPPLRLLSVCRLCRRHQKLTLFYCQAKENSHACVEQKEVAPIINFRDRSHAPPPSAY